MHLVPLACACGARVRVVQGTFVTLPIVAYAARVAAFAAQNAFDSTQPSLAYVDNGQNVNHQCAKVVRSNGAYSPSCYWCDGSPVSLPPQPDEVTDVGVQGIVDE